MRYVTGPIPFHYGVYEETATMTLTMSNLVLVDSREEPYFVWKPDEMTGVPFSAQLQHAQAGTCTVKVEVFTSDNNVTPILVREFTSVPRPGVWQWEWDGRLADGSTAPRGIYLYRLSAEARVPTLPDRDSNRSAFLQALRAVDENNEPMLYAEYWGYDDKQTPEDETDDEHLYFIRWYVLKDSLNTNASSGRIQLFNPDLTTVYSWDITALRCLEHGEATDGLRADSTGIKHGVIVPVPVSVMQLGGDYRFLLQVKDDHMAFDKAHRLRAALELNSRPMPQAYYIWVSGTCPDYASQNNIAWSYIRETLYYARIHGAVMTITNGAHAGVQLGTWTVSYRGLSESQVQSQRQWARQNGWAEVRTMVLAQAIAGIGFAQVEASVARIQDKRRNTPPSDPAIAAINENWFQQHDWDAEQDKWGRTNALLHELTHLLNDRNKNHCKARRPTCVWNSDLDASTWTRPLRNTVRIRGVDYHMPWHDLAEINEMRLSLGWPPLSP